MTHEADVIGDRAHFAQLDNALSDDLKDYVEEIQAEQERLLLVAGSHLPPELDHLFLKVDHSLGAHGCQSNEFHDYRPYPVMAGEGFVELREPVVEFPSDNGFGVELYSPHFAECREIGCFFGIGLHLASVGPLAAARIQAPPMSLFPESPPKSRRRHVRSARHARLPTVDELAGHRLLN